MEAVGASTRGRGMLVQAHEGQGHAGASAWRSGAAGASAQGRGHGAQTGRRERRVGEGTRVDNVVVKKLYRD